MVKQLKSLTFVNDNISNTYQVSSNTTPDWNQNDETASDYVKNRTHYISDPVETVLLEETSIEFIDTDTVLLPGFIKLIEGCTYFVTFNRTEYECVAYGYNDSGMAIIGNGSLLGVEGGNGEPFVSVFMEHNTSALFVTQEAGTYALKIVGMIPEVVQLPAQFLVNSNICNGEGEYSINEGRGTAYGDFSHAEGMSTASGDFSHAEGEAATASGYASHAEGVAVIASGRHQHVQGRYNLRDTENKYALIVGNGIANARSNAHTLDWEGNAWFAGKIYTGGTGQDDGATEIVSLPAVTEADNGKVLRVVNGVWTAVSLNNAEGVSF